MEKTENALQERFEHWLVDMDRYLEELRQAVPPDLSEALDYSAGSLDLLEAHLLARYDSVAALKDESTGAMWNNAGVYFGETIRKRLGGKWQVKLGTPESAFYGLPIMENIPGAASTICPMALVSASLDRRTGHFLSDRIRAWEKA